MKVYNYLIFLILTTLTFTAQANFYFTPDSVGDVDIEGQNIVYQDQRLGKVETKALPSKDDKSNCFQVTIFERGGTLIAEYNVEVLKGKKRKQEAILFAQVKTIKDKVVHNGSNFIDSQQTEDDNSQETTLQLKRVIGYLRLHRYL